MRFGNVARSALACLALGCATSAPPLTSEAGAVVGVLRLVPHAGAESLAGGGAGYDDRRLRDVRRMDYSAPGFAVVWIDAPTRPGAVERAELRAGAVAPRLSPPWSAVAVGGVLALSNRTSEAYTVSCPSLGVVRRLEPGASLELRADSPGAHPFYVLERDELEGGVFAAPGPFAVLRGSGDFALRELAPGPAALHVFHPRLPPVARDVVVPARGEERVELDIGVGRAQEARDAKP